MIRWNWWYLLYEKKMVLLIQLHVPRMKNSNLSYKLSFKVSSEVKSSGDHANLKAVLFAFSASKIILSSKNKAIFAFSA